MRLRVGDFAELKHTHPTSQFDRTGDFLCIYYILKDTTIGEVQLRGLRLKRTHDSEGLFPPEVNELFLKIDVREDNTRSLYEQNLATITVRDVVTKREVRVINQSFPAYSFRPARGWDSSNARVEKAVLETYELVCRWLSVRYFTNKNSKKPRYQLLGRFRQAEAMLRYSVSDPMLAIQHTGGPIRKIDGKYTMGDCFAGFGGVSTGATQAGFHPKWAFDMEPNAIKVYYLNNQRTRVYTEEVFEFLTKRLGITPNGIILDKYRVHALHISPVCKTIAWYKTGLG